MAPFWLRSVSVPTIEPRWNGVWIGSSTMMSMSKLKTCSMSSVLVTTMLAITTAPMVPPATVFCRRSKTVSHWRVQRSPVSVVEPL